MSDVCIGWDGTVAACASDWTIIYGYLGTGFSDAGQVILTNVVPSFWDANIPSTVARL